MGTGRFFASGLRHGEDGEPATPQQHRAPTHRTRPQPTEQHLPPWPAECWPGPPSWPSHRPRSPSNTPPARPGWSSARRSTAPRGTRTSSSAPAAGHPVPVMFGVRPWARLSRNLLTNVTSTSLSPSICWCSLARASGTWGNLVRRMVSFGAQPVNGEIDVLVVLLDPNELPTAFCCCEERCAAASEWIEDVLAGC